MSGDVTVRPGPAASDPLEGIDVDLASRVAQGDPTVWGPDATSEASVRLGWLKAPQVSRELLPRLAELKKSLQSKGLDVVVLGGMGGSSLAPEVIARSAGVDLTVLDTTDPGQVRAALADRLDRTVLVVSSKSGGTVETDSHRRVYEQAFRDAGIDPAERIIVVTDPGSSLEQTAKDAGYETFTADPDVGGRYSALTAFGLVPTALAGVDVEALLAEAEALQPLLAETKGNPGLLLGALLGQAAVAGHDKVVLAPAEDDPIVGFGDWAEQLLAESTGKQGKGILPVVVEGIDAPGFTPAADTFLTVLGTDPGGADVAVAGPLGAQFMTWEYATAVAGRLLGINPFDQPNVQESKDNTGALLETSGTGPLPEGAPAFVDGEVAVYADLDLLNGAGDLSGALAALLDAVPAGGYLAVMAYLDRRADAAAAQLRPVLARRLASPVTFGWAPRFLHSTGQYHKGGPQNGAFLQITGAVAEDLEVPGRPYTFGRLQMAQALGDLGALAGRGRPAVRFHLRNRAAGLRQLRAAAGS